MSPRSPLSSLLLLAVLSGCGPADLDEKKKSTEPIQQWSGDNSFADEYFVDDLRCQNEAGSEGLGSTSIHLFTDGAGTDVPHDFTGFNSVDSLSGPGFLRTFYDFHQVSQCSRENDPTSCGDAKVLTQPKRLKVCRPNGPYPRISVEGIALTSMANLSYAYDYYQTLASKSPTLASTDLLVLPKLENDYGTHTDMDTDNLAYAPSFVAGVPVFIIHPKSARAVRNGRWTDLNLWEVPWGLAHEFGHHVFRTHTGISSITSSVGMAIDEHLPIHSIKDEKSAAAGFSLQGRTVTAKDHWSAINEGFADLYAFYAHGSKEGLTKGLDCFDQNREITVDTFTMGTKKRLDQEVIGTWLSPKDDGGSTCDAPSLQDSHTIGAIVAHGVDRLFQARIGGDAAAASQAKAELLIKWAEAMGKTAGAVSDQDLTVERLLLDAVRVVASNSNKLSASMCASLRDVFPEYADGWLTGAFTCE